MTKKKYIRRLRKALKGIPEREKDKLIDYYSEMIDESFERGKTQKEVFDGLEPPEQVAREYFNANEGIVGGIYEDSYEDYAPRRPKRKRVRLEETDDYEDARSEKPYREKKGRSPLVTILLIPFYIVLFVLGLAALIVGVSLVIATVILVVAFFASGIFCIAMSFGLIASHGAIAATQIGAGIVLLGLSLLCGLLVAPVGRGFCRFSGWLLRGGRASQNVRAERGHKRAIITACVGIALVIAGGASGAFGFGKLGWNWKNLAVVGDFAEKTQTVSLEELSTLQIESDNLSLNIMPTQETEATLTYYDCEELPKTYAFENGVLTLDSGEWNHSAKSYLREVWKRGVFFSTVMSDVNKAVLYLPQSYMGALSVSVKNGALKMQDITLGDVTLTTNNGLLSVQNCTLNTLSANTDNGAVKFSEVTAHSLSANTDNGEIAFTRISAHDISLKVSNGAINGSIVGVQSEYRIQAKTQLGSCNLSDTQEGDKTLTANAACGSIKIKFVD